MGSTVPEKMEEQGDEGRAGGLAHKAGRSQHTAGTSGAVIGGRAEQHMVVGRLEETEAGSAHHQPPCNIHMRGILGDEREQETARTHQQQTEKSEQSRMYLTDKRAGQRGHEHDDQRPGGRQQSGLKGMATIAIICAVKETMLVTTDIVNTGMRRRSNGSIGYFRSSWLRT